MPFQIQRDGIARVNKFFSIDLENNQYIKFPTWTKPQTSSAEFHYLLRKHSQVSKIGVRNES